MKIKSTSTGVVLLLTIGLISAVFLTLGCAEEETPAEPAVTEPEVTEPAVTEPEVTEPEVTEPAETESFLASEIIGIEWQWTGLKEFDPAGQSVVPDPENYTLALLPDGTYLVKADCNQGSGNYVLEEDSLTLEPGPMTLAECGPESQYDKYVTLLSNVKSAAMENDQLILYSGDKGDKMFFTSGGPVEQ